MVKKSPKSSDAYVDDLLQQFINYSGLLVLLETIIELQKIVI